MYLYGVSLGATIQTHYMINDNENTPYSGMVSYANLFAPDVTVAQFKAKMFGLYDWGMGVMLNWKIRDSLPELAKYSTKEQIETYRHGLYNESYRLTSIDTHVIAPMFGFRDSMDYYTSSRLSGNLHKIKRCPTMFL